MTTKTKIGKSSLFIFSSLPIFLLVVVTLALRIALSFLPSFDIDMGSWLAWASRLADLGPGRFYSDIVWTQYTPGFLYWLWFGGKIGWVNELLVKLPVIFADIATGILIWWMVRRKEPKLATLSFFFYTLNPAIIFAGPVWGQIDGIFTLALILSVFFLVEKKNILLVGLFWGISFLIKPQALALVPPLAIVAAKKFKPKELALGGLVVILIVIFGALPFFPKEPILGLPQLVAKMGEYYSYTSVFAFNLWSFFGMWQPDANLFFGISYFVWGILAYGLSLVLIFFVFRRKLTDKGSIFLVFSLSLLAFFLFPTRVHERYLFPFFAFFLVAAGLKKSKAFFGLYTAASFAFLVNLYHPYAYYMDNFLKSEGLLKITGLLTPLVALFLLSLFVSLLTFLKNGEFKFRFFQKEKRPAKQKDISAPRLKVFLALILGFSLLTRVAWLTNPESEYFDEVYHAFTARRMLHNDPKVWEWWNTPPEGFAYEWTHPPLAKEGMVLGMLVFGENSFGWRIPGALLGVGSVFLVYLIARTLFKDELIGLLSSAVFALDGLPLVISRIGMNDAYFLFFILLSLYLFLANKYFPSALSLGLAAAAKWSAVWALPIFVVAHFVFKRKISKKYLWFFVLPPLVYLARIKINWPNHQGPAPPGRGIRMSGGKSCMVPPHLLLDLDKLAETMAGHKHGDIRGKIN